MWGEGEGRLTTSKWLALNDNKLLRWQMVFLDRPSHHTSHYRSRIVNFSWSSELLVFAPCLYSRLYNSVQSWTLLSVVVGLSPCLHLRENIYQHNISPLDFEINHKRPPIFSSIFMKININDPIGDEHFPRNIFITEYFNPSWQCEREREDEKWVFNCNDQTDREPVKTECCKLVASNSCLPACCYVDLTTSGTLQSSDLWISSLQLGVRPELLVFAEI